MKIIPIVVAIAAIGFGASASAESCAEMSERAQAEAQGGVDEINAGVAHKMAAIKTRAEERWTDLESKVAAGKLDEEGAKAKFAALEQEAKEESAKVQSWAEEEYTKVRAEAEAKVTKGMETCEQ